MLVERRGFSLGAILFERIKFQPRRAAVAAAIRLAIDEVFRLIGMLRASAN
jgi:hypothetical protein